jgi:hypothetical protein
VNNYTPWQCDTKMLQKRNPMTALVLLQRTRPDSVYLACGDKDELIEKLCGNEPLDTVVEVAAEFPTMGHALEQARSALAGTPCHDGWYDMPPGAALQALGVCMGAKKPGNLPKKPKTFLTKLYREDRLLIETALREAKAGGNVEICKEDRGYLRGTWSNTNVVYELCKAMQTELRELQQTVFSIKKTQFEVLNKMKATTHATPIEPIVQRPADGLTEDDPAEETNVKALKQPTRRETYEKEQDMWPEDKLQLQDLPQQLPQEAPEYDEELPDLLATCVPATTEVEAQPVVETPGAEQCPEDHETTHPDAQEHSITDWLEEALEQIATFAISPPARQTPEELYDDLSDLSSICGDESPPHRQLKEYVAARSVAKSAIVMEDTFAEPVQQPAALIVAQMDSVGVKLVACAKQDAGPATKITQKLRQMFGCKAAKAMMSQYTQVVLRDRGNKQRYWVDATGATVRLELQTNVAP